MARYLKVLSIFLLLCSTSQIMTASAEQAAAPAAPAVKTLPPTPAVPAAAKPPGAVPAPAAAPPAAPGAAAAKGAPSATNPVPMPLEPGAAAAAAAAATVKGPAGLTADEMKAFFRGSFFLSAVEIAVIQQAINGRVPTLANQTLALEKHPLTVNAAPAIPARRIIRISGVVYRGPGDWVVWLNGQKVTPKRLLPEIIEIDVKSSSYVGLKWYDVGFKKVFRIALRPQQSYDLATGILVPGTVQ